MKFRCERDALVDALSTAGRAVATRGALPVLSGLRLEVRGDVLSLAGTDIDLTIQSEVEVSGIADGLCVVPARLLTDIVRSLEQGAVTIEVGDDDAKISAGRSQFSVHTLAAEDFPRLPAAGSEGVTLNAAHFSESLRQVVRAASTDDALPVISGVLMAATEDGGLRLVATDRYRLAKRDLPGTSVLRSGQKVLVPGRALNELQRVLSNADDVTLVLGERDATFVAGSVRLTTRLLEGEFVPYEQLIPSNYPNRLWIGKEPFLDAVRRVKLLARDTITPVRVTLRPDSDTIECVVRSTEGEATDFVDAKYEGSEVTIGFNPAYLIDGLEAVHGDEVLLETLDPMKPATVRASEDEDYLYLLMPVRL